MAIKSYTPSEIAEKHGMPIDEAKGLIEDGARVEKERTDNETTARDIASARVWESTRYYKSLAAMEKQLDADSKKEDIINLLGKLSPEEYARINNARKIDEGNYYESTSVTWRKIGTGKIAAAKYDELKDKQGVKIKKSPKSSSKYLIDGDKIYRYSDHWGNIASVGWHISPPVPEHQERMKEWSLGQAEFSDFKNLSMSPEEIANLYVDSMRNNKNPELLAEINNLLELKKKELELATPKKVFAYVSVLNPKVSTASSLGNFVSKESEQLSDSRRGELMKYVNEDSTAYSILRDTGNLFSEKQLWVITYDLLKNPEFIEMVSEYYGDIEQYEQGKKARKSAKREKKAGEKKQRMAQVAASENKYKEIESSDLVTEPTYGTGKVISQDDQTIKVYFEKYGEKVFMKRFAKLEKVNIDPIENEPESFRTETVYRVMIDHDNEAKVVLSTTDGDEAQRKYNSIDSRDFDNPNSNYNSAYIDKKTNKYKFVGTLDEGEEISDYDYDLQDTDYWELVEEGEYENIDSKKVSAANQETDEMINQLALHYGTYGGYKIIHLDEDGNVTVNLRIKDHSGLRKNRGGADYMLSIVIANINATKEFYTQGPEGFSRDEEFVFDSDISVQEVISFIDGKIEEFRQDAIEKGLIKNEPDHSGLNKSLTGQNKRLSQEIMAVSLYKINKEAKRYRDLKKELFNYSKGDNYDVELVANYLGLEINDGEMGLWTQYDQFITALSQINEKISETNRELINTSDEADDADLKNDLGDYERVRAEFKEKTEDIHNKIKSFGVRQDGLYELKNRFLRKLNLHPVVYHSFPNGEIRPLYEFAGYSFHGEPLTSEQETALSENDIVAISHEISSEYKADKEISLDEAVFNLKAFISEAPGLNKSLIRTATVRGDQISVYSVDANYVRANFHPDWNSGGHFKGWPEGMPFIPKGEIWIDQSADETAREGFILHEVFEYALMVYDNIDYEKAHDQANKVEQDYLMFVTKYGYSPAELSEKWMNGVHEITGGFDIYVGNEKIGKSGKPMTYLEFIKAISEQPATENTGKMENSELEKTITEKYKPSKKSSPEAVKTVLLKKNITDEDREILYNYEGEGSVKGADTKTGILHEFFTPDWLTYAMAEILKGVGAKTDNVLDPAIGTGRLMKYLNAKNITGFEVNRLNAEITQKLYPKAQIHNLPFETAFLQPPRYTTLAKKSWIGNDFDLVISNPPYGVYGGEFATYMPKVFNRFEFLFVAISMNLVKSGGFGMFVLPQLFMNNGNSYNKQKEEIMKHNKFIDAIRLPNGIFASTDIGVDLLILQKK